MVMNGQPLEEILGTEVQMFMSDQGLAGQSCSIINGAYQCNGYTEPVGAGQQFTNDATAEAKNNLNSGYNR